MLEERRHESGLKAPKFQKKFALWLRFRDSKGRRHGRTESEDALMRWKRYLAIPSIFDCLRLPNHGPRYLGALQVFKGVLRNTLNF